ncbi:MAG: LCP family protein [Bacillota bacterium]
MKDKDLEKSLKEFHNADLKFTEEDRKKVFRKIDDQHNSRNKWFFLNFGRRAAPLMAMAVLLTLSIVLAYSLIGDGNSQTADQADKETAMDQQDAKTLLFLLKNENNRTDLHLLISYSKRNGSVNLTSLPRDIYVTAPTSSEDEPDMDKLTNIFGFGAGEEAVKNTISTALDLAIDHYVSVEKDDFVQLLNSIGETKLTLEEGKTLLSSESAKNNLPKGPNYLDGNEAVSLLSASSRGEGNRTEWTEEDRLKLSEAVMINMLTHVRPEEADFILRDAETNVELETVMSELAATRLNAMDTISVTEYLDPVRINDTFYLQFKEGAEGTIKRKLLNFD